MMLRERKLGVLFEVATKARSRISSRIENELATATDLDVFAAGSVASFATTFAGHRAFEV